MTILDLVQVSDDMFEDKIEEATLSRFPAQMDKVLLSLMEPDNVSKFILPTPFSLPVQAMNILKI